MFLNCISPNVDTTRIDFLWIGFWNSSMLISYKNNTISIIYHTILLLNVFGNITISLFLNRFWLIRFYKTWSIAMVPVYTGSNTVFLFWRSRVNFKQTRWNTPRLGLPSSVIHICIEYSYPYSKNAFQYELNLALLRLSCTKCPLP